MQSVHNGYFLTVALYFLFFIVRFQPPLRVNVYPFQKSVSTVESRAYCIIFTYTSLVIFSRNMQCRVVRLTDMTPQSATWSCVSDSLTQRQ